MNIDTKTWNKNTISFLASQAVSILGSMLVQYAITWHITLVTGSGTMMTLAIIAGFIPSFLITPFSGVLADRISKKNLIIFSDLFIAFTTLILAILLTVSDERIWIFIVALALRSFGTGIQSPAIGSFIPEFVPENSLMRVNGINGTIQTFIMIISPAISAALLSAFPLNTFFFIDVVTAVIAVLILKFVFSLPSKQVPNVEHKQELNFIEDTKAGFAYIKSHPYVRVFFLFCAGFFFLISPSAFLTPLQAVRLFGESVWNLSALEIAFSSGMFVGGILISSWGGFKNKVLTMIYASLMIAVFAISLGFVKVLWGYLLIMGIFGLSVPVFSTPSMTLIQQKVDPAFIGRVFGVFSMISTSMMPLGMVLFGPLADTVSIELILIVSGILLLFITLVILKNKQFVAAGLPSDANEDEITPPQ
jgi:DHA3 family macrolide efflux protein-like MFS transporter